MADGWNGPLKKTGTCRYMIPKDYKPGMRVPGIIYADDTLIETVRQDEAPEQVANVAFLPGIVGASLAMPDIHLGYGFAIGGVAATDVETGVISPGGVGYDINCGVRIITSVLSVSEVRKRIDDIISAIFKAVPSGVGSEGKIKLSPSELSEVMLKGAAWAVAKGYGDARDLEFCEENGAMPGADPDAVSDKAAKRGNKQVGTLGSGNHFLEVSEVAAVYDEKAAEVYGLRLGQVVFQIHSGSRGLGHQVCTDYISVMVQALKKYEISLPDKQLACAPVKSPEGQRYLGAMAAAANYAWANRQVMTHWVRQAVASVFGSTPERLEMRLLYDVAHNIAKLERHPISPNGPVKLLCVHRKGATRAFGPGNPSIPPAYRDVGQPVLVPGDMGRCSYVLSGTRTAMQETFGSCCHGAGRLMSRASAKKEVRGKELQRELLERGILVKTDSVSSLGEEAPEVYKDVSLVVDVTEKAGLAKKVVMLKPIGVIKG